jgi:hydrogenase-4 component B
LKIDFAFSNPLPTGTVAMLLIVLSAAIYLLYLQTSKVKIYKTWDCGFDSVSAKAQVTSDSFAQPLARIFRPFLRYKNISKIQGQDRRHFPESVSVETQIISILEQRVYLPSLGVVGGLAKLLARLQAGSIHLYLLYVCATLILLLFMGMAI